METHCLFKESVRKAKCGGKRTKVIRDIWRPERGENKPDRNTKRTLREIFKQSTIVQHLFLPISTLSGNAAIRNKELELTCLLMQCCSDALKPVYFLIFNNRNN